MNLSPGHSDDAAGASYRGWPLFRAWGRPRFRSVPERRARGRYLGAMRRRNLLTQVLFVNLLLIVAAVVTAAIAGQSRRRPVRRRPGSALVLGLAVGADDPRSTCSCSSAASSRSSELVDQMERADLSRPGANLRAAARPALARGGRPAAPGVRAHARAPRGRAAAHLERRARRAGGGARPGRPRPPRRGQPVAHRPAAAPRGGAREGAARARRRARARPGARQPGDAGAADARPPAAPDGARRPRAQGGARRQRARARPPGRGRARASRPTATLGRCPQDVQLVVYRVAQEALSNAARHSGAEHVAGRAAPRGRPGRARASPTTGAGSPSTRPLAGSGSRACASARCSSAATSRSSRGPGIGTRVRLAGADRETSRCTSRGRERDDVRVLIADDHGIVRSGLRMLLERQDGHRGDRRGLRRRRGPRHGDPRAPRPGDPRRQDAEADRPAGDARDPRAGARRLGADPLDVRRRALPVRGAEGRRLRLRAEGPGRRRPARGGPRGRARRALPHPRGAAGADQGRARPGRRPRATS